MSLNIENPYPEDFAQAFFEKADFELAFRALSGKKDFFSDALRGYIRTIQFRFQEAWKWFGQASEKSEECEETLPTLARSFLLNIYNFYCALWEMEPARELNYPKLDIDTSRIPQYPLFLIRIILMRNLAEATLLLHTGRFSQAIIVYNSILTQGAASEYLPPIYLGIAACHHNLFQREKAERFLENAELATTAITDSFWRLQASAMLIAAFTYLQNPQKVYEWLAYLLATSCPKVSKEVFARHAELMNLRSKNKGYLVVL